MLPLTPPLSILQASKRRSVHKIFLEYGFSSPGSPMQVTKRKEPNEREATAYVYKLALGHQGSGSETAAVVMPGAPAEQGWAAKTAIASWGGVSQKLAPVSSGDLCEAERYSLQGIGSVKRPSNGVIARTARHAGTEGKFWLGMAYADTNTTTIRASVDLKTSDELTDTEARDTRQMPRC
jgi:hypothetical protein